MQKEDYDIRIGDIEPGCEENIIEKQMAVTSIYHMSFPALATIANRFFPGNLHKQKEALQEFYTEKICTKSIRRLKHIKEIGLPYLATMFNNHLIDILRRAAKERERTETYIEREKAITDEAIEQDWRPIEDRIEITIKKYKKIIADNFRAEHYPEIFELIALGYSNPEISEMLGIKAPTVGTARCRIKKFLKNQGRPK